MFLRQRSKLKQIGRIRPEFDAPFYRSAFGHYLSDGDDPVSHYLLHGQRMGTDPVPWFSARTYLASYPDVVASGLDPFFHFIAHGRAEGRSITPSEVSFAGGKRVLDKNSTQLERTQVRSDLSNDALLDVYSEFDATYYRQQTPELKGSDADLFRHYLERGWRERKDPSKTFSTSYYLEKNPDIAASKSNPFEHYILHGRKEGRVPAPYHHTKILNGSPPSVTAIVPNYNHAQFLENRIRSICAQTLPPRELIILDDASTDDSVERINSLAKRIGDLPFRLEISQINSGNVFKQWEKGIRLASGDLIWICESDDFCSPSFLASLAVHFIDPSVMLGFGKVQFANAAGIFLPGLDDYRESSAPGQWNAVNISEACQWFDGPFGRRNVIPNVGGCLFRRQEIEPEVWDQVQKFTVCGDWYLYAFLSRAGRIAYEPSAVSYFRQHGRNTSVSQFTNLTFYEEHARVAAYLRQIHGASDGVTCELYDHVKQHFIRHLGRAALPSLYAAFSLNEVIETTRTARHVAIGILGFRTGGGEILPIHLANALVQRGFQVSVLVLDPSEENTEIRKLLDPRIPIFERGLVEEIGATQFFLYNRVDLIHTHFSGVDVWLHQACRAAKLPYVVTHHGSYDGLQLNSDIKLALLEAVTHWVYIADKNLKSFAGVPLDPSRLTKLPNALPETDEAFLFSRHDLAIEEDAFVFGLASRALEEKGWEIAIKALLQIKADTERNVYLLFCGDGPALGPLAEKYASEHNVKFLGFQKNITGFYKICDCCLLPSRFMGESFPLTLVEALYASKPAIATDLGEIPNMLSRNGLQAGMLIPVVDADEVFVDLVVSAMKSMMEGNTYASYRDAAGAIKNVFSFPDLVDRYVDIYNRVLSGQAHGAPNAMMDIEKRRHA